MSSKPVHYSAGVVLAGVSAYFLKDYFSVWQIGLIAAGCLWGSSAPDWMEISGWLFKSRYSLIPHRTITHWMLAWLALTVWTGLNANSLRSIEWLIAFGFCLSALIHVLMDARSPMGVPVWHPWRRTPGRRR